MRLQVCAAKPYFPSLWEWKSVKNTYITVQKFGVGNIFISKYTFIQQEYTKLIKNSK